MPLISTKGVYGLTAMYELSKYQEDTPMQIKEISANANIPQNYLEQLLSIFGVQLIELVTYKPMQCTTPSNAPVNTEQLRYKVLLKLQSPVNADMDCIIKNYLPAYLRIDIVED